MIGPGSPRGHQLQAAWRSVLYIHLFIAEIGSLHSVWSADRKDAAAKEEAKLQPLQVAAIAARVALHGN